MKMKVFLEIRNTEKKFFVMRKSSYFEVTSQFKSGFLTEGTIKTFLGKTTSLVFYKNCTTQFCRIKGCGGEGSPPLPIIFERLKLHQQIIYRQKGNLSESANHFKYQKNILISRFYEQFSRSSRILGHFWKFEKISNS